MAARKVDQDKDVDVDDTKNMKEDPSGYKEKVKKNCGKQRNRQGPSYYV